jgi:hypothetical protein
MSSSITELAGQFDARNRNQAFANIAKEMNDELG